MRIGNGEEANYKCKYEFLKAGFFLADLLQPQKVCRAGATGTQSMSMKVGCGVVYKEPEKALFVKCMFHSPNIQPPPAGVRGIP